MRILYTAIDQCVPGTDGGAVHVEAVARGLSELGHEVHALVTPGEGAPPESAQWHAESPVFGIRQLRLLSARRIARLTRQLRPDVVIERYYNFGGEGVLAAQQVAALLVLEVNAPVVDHPGSRKRLLDRLVLVEPMRRWREWQCSRANLIVTPTSAILPPGVSPDKIVELEWGADTRRFHPDATGPVPFHRQPGETVVVFAGAFRIWHGASKLVEAILELRRRGQTHVRAVFIGEGPELDDVRRQAHGTPGIEFLGRIPHERMPSALAAFRFSLVGFTLPFMFIYRPALLLMTPDGGDLLAERSAAIVPLAVAVVTAALGIVALAAGIAGCFRAPIGWPLRCANLLAAAMLLAPGVGGLAAGRMLSLAGAIVFFGAAAVSWRAGENPSTA